MKIHKFPIPEPRARSCPASAGAPAACREIRAPEGDIRDSCAAAIASIAFEEAAIARILSAEGEKLREIQASGNGDPFLAVNEAARQTIAEVTRLEQILYSKLSAVNRLYSEAQAANGVSQTTETSCQ